MPPLEALEKKHFDTTNSDDIKEAFYLVSQTIKELNDKLDKFAKGSLKRQAPETKQLDTMNPDDIKKSFLLFSRTIKNLDIQLNKFANACSRLGHVTALLSAIKQVQEKLQWTREVFFHNATALAPELQELAHTEARESESRDSSSKQFYIRSRYFEATPSFTALPTVLKQLAKSFRLLQVRTDEFPEFTEQGTRLKDLLSTLGNFLHYRASCAQEHTNRLNTPIIQRYIHQFIYHLQTDFGKVAAALGEFTAISIPAIRGEQARITTNLVNILAAATLFSGVTASTLQFSATLSNKDNTILVVNALWFTSLILSVGAALNCVLYGAFVNLLDVTKPLISSNSDSGKLPSWIRIWMDGSHIFLLGASILTFSAGLSVFTFSSNQANYTPYLIIASMVLASAGLGAILIWILYKILMAPKELADAIRYSSSDSIYSESIKSSFSPGRIAVFIKNAMPWSLLRKLDNTLNDVEQAELKTDELEESQSQERGLLDQPGAMAKTQGEVNIDQKKKYAPGEINNSAMFTELILPDETVPEKIEFKCHGSIRNIKYSDDGKWLAVFCAKEESRESWTTVLDAKTFESFRETYHTNSALFGPLEWSPLGKKLIVKLGSRYNVWDLAPDTVQVIDLKWIVHDSDVVWFDEDAFLAAGNFAVIKTDLTGRQMGEYKLKENFILSIGIERENNYLILFTCILRTPEQINLGYSGRLEKRIVIYDMDKAATLYQVPILEDIFYAYPIPGTLDILITQMDQKLFQLWSRHADLGCADMLKKRTATPHDNVDPGDNIEFNLIGGNRNQFVFSMMKSGIIDIWRRETGKLYRRFRSPILQEGVQCFSWRRSDDETATFAAAEVGSHTLLVWRGKQVPETSNNPKLAMNEKIRNR